MEQSTWIPWTIPWIPYGMVWNSPYGFHGLFHGFHMEWDFLKKIHQVQYGIHVHSMDWIPWIPPGIHME